MKLMRTIAVAMILETSVGLSGARAQNDNGSIDVKALLKRIEELEQKVKVLEGKSKPDAAIQLDQEEKTLKRKSELANEVAAEKAKAAPLVTIGSGGLAVVQRTRTLLCACVVACRWTDGSSRATPWRTIRFICAGYRPGGDGFRKIRLPADGGFRFRSGADDREQRFHC